MLKQRAAFNKLVLRRNKLHARLVRLDKQASDLIMRGQKPLVIYAEQVSVQDELDLVELQLAITSTRQGLPVPPLPGQEPMPPGTSALFVDDATRNLERAFARGRERALQRLRQDTEQFLASLDFSAFLYD